MSTAIDRLYNDYVAMKTHLESTKEISLLSNYTNTFRKDASSTKGYYVMPPYDGQQDTTAYKITKLVGKVNFASSM